MSEKWLFKFFILAFCSLGYYDAEAKNLTRYYNDLFEENDLDVWEAPAEIRRQFSYYWSGFDEECRPIWIGEMGKWNVKKILDLGEENMLRAALRKYADQGIYRLLESLKYNNTECGGSMPTEIVGIMDVEGFNYLQTVSTRTVSYVMNIIKDFIPLMMSHVHNIYFINTNYVANGFVSMARPILGEFMARVEVYGTRKSNWIPRLLKNLPRDQLPEKFGGKKGFTPYKGYS